jgi:uncharacterized protein
MPGLENLAKLLESMNPELGSEEYVFVTCKKPADECPGARPWAVINEKEGVTLILGKNEADRYGMQGGSVFRRITLNVHSSLDAVGLTAAIATKLAKAGISANVVAGYFHDHVFVQKDRAEESVGLLKELSRESCQPV